MHKLFLFLLCTALLAGCAQKTTDTQTGESSFGEVKLSVDYSTLTSDIEAPVLNPEDVNTYISNEILSLEGSNASDTPVLTDELATTLSNGQSHSAKEYRSYVENKLKKENEEAFIYSCGLDLFNQLLSIADITCNEKQVQEEILILKQQYENLALRDGISLDEYILYEGFSSLNEFNEQIREKAISAVQKMALTEQLAKDFNISVTETELSAHYSSLDVDPEYVSDSAVEQIRNYLLIENVLYTLGELANDDK